MLGLNRHLLSGRAASSHVQTAATTTSYFIRGPTLQPQPQPSCSGCNLEYQQPGHLSRRLSRYVVAHARGKSSQDPDKKKQPKKGSDASSKGPVEEPSGPDWENPLLDGFPEERFEDEEDVDDVLEDDILARALNSGRRSEDKSDVDRLQRNIRRGIDDDEEYEDEDEDEDEYGEEGEEAEEDEIIDGDEPVWEQVDVSEAGFSMDTMDYSSIVQERDAKISAGAEITGLSQSEIDAMRAEADAAAAAALAKPEGSQLSLNRQGYQAFEMDQLELLVAETADGKLDLADSYVFDAGAEVYARPTLGSGLPSGPVPMQVIPWVERRSPDTLKQKPGLAKMRKVYFVGLQSVSPWQVKLDEVFMFDGKSRSLTKQEVRTVGKPKDPVLRIRADGVVIEDSFTVPTAWKLAMMQYNGDEGAPPELDEESRQAALQERLEELEAMAEELDELDEAPDAPSSDLM